MRVVFFSDTHLGFDLPVRPRARSAKHERRRRGEDFFANVDRVLVHAAGGSDGVRADLVLHGGDVFFRSRVAPYVVDRAYARLVRFVNETGIPFGIIAGNHDRSTLPAPLLLAHEKIHVFHRAQTHVFALGGVSAPRVAVTGLPFTGDAGRFVEQARASMSALDAPPSLDADAHILLAHEAFDGATCGPAGFTFRAAQRPDTIALAAGNLGDARAVLDPLDVVLSGHIHRRQVLLPKRADGSALPVVYAGSVERTSFAEKDETKSFAVIELSPRVRRDGSAHAHGRVRFVPLPARPMVDVDGSAVVARDEEVLAAVARAPPDAIVRVTCDGARAARLHRAGLARHAPASASVAVRVRENLTPSSSWDGRATEDRRRQTLLGAGRI